MTDVQWAGLRVTVIGLAREGTALARFLVRHGAQVTVSDVKGPAELEGRLAQLAGLDVRLALGGHPPEVLAADVVFLSPGVPADAPVAVEARRLGAALSSETRLFTRLCPAPIVGITGSAGKTTTVTLVGRMLAASGFRTLVGGNIGQPLIEQVESIAPDDRVVLELSSFQLEGFGPAVPPARAFPEGGWSPPVAAITNITPNHLDRHPTMQAYIDAKANILRYQTGESRAILNADDPIVCGLRGECRGAVSQFSLETEPAVGAWLAGEALLWRPEPGQKAEHICNVSELRLRGRHNIANVLTACAASGAAGATAAAMREVAISFAGVEHREELVRTLRGVAYYNNSIATSPERVMATLRSFSEPLVLLAGGRDKHLPWDEWAALVNERVREVICFGEMAPLLQRVLGSVRTDGGARVHVCDTMEQAVELAAQIARPGDVVLLSPGGTSFDAYADFEARGAAFRAAVHALV